MTGAVHGRHGVDVLALGLDIGTSNAKAVLTAIDGGADGSVRVLASAATPTPDDPDALVAAVVSLVRTVLADAARPPDVVGIASMAETGAALDANGAALTPWLRWDRGRGVEESRRLADDLGRDALFAATGVRPSPKVPLATWAWLRTNQPEVWVRLRRWSGVADFVCLAMTGRLATDHTLAGRTMAYALPDVGGPLPSAFDADLLAVVGLSADQLPDVVQPGDVVGVVRSRKFTAAGLRSGTPVVVAGHDHAVGAYAAGVREPGEVANSVGTTEAVLTVVAARPDPGAVAAEGMSLVRTVSGRHDALLAGSASAGSMLGWWLDAVCGGSSAAELFAAAAGVPAAPTGVLVLPYLSGRQAPAPDPTAAVEVLGVRLEHTRGHLSRALLEGLALQVRWMLDAQRRLAAGARGSAVDDEGHATIGATTDTTHSAEDTTSGGVPRQRTVMVLGAPVTSSPAWMEVKADVTPADLRLVDAAEPVACGAALVAADRAGMLPGGVPSLLGRAVSRSSGLAVGAYDRMYADFVVAATAASASGRVVS